MDSAWLFGSAHFLYLHFYSKPSMSHIRLASEVTADLTLEDGSATFENRKVFFDEYSHDDVEVNHLKVSEEKSSKQ